MRRSCLLLACVLFAVEARGQGLTQDSSESATVPLAGVAAAAPAPATTTAAQASVFRSGIDLVALNIVVTDGQQKFVSGLRVDQFAVYEDGVQQDVSYFAATDVPLDLAILLDTSASMTDKILTVQRAATGFVGTMRPQDRVMIVDIKDATKIVQPLSGDVSQALAAIKSTAARGGTGLFNGLYLTLKQLTKERRDTSEVRRQAIIVLSDGDDTASLVTYEDVMEVAKRAGIAIYTITLRSPVDLRSATSGAHRYFSQSEYAMKSLAKETGARAFFPIEISELTGVYSSIAEELATEYSLGYTSKNPKRDGAYRRVIVRIAEQPGVQTRTRNGYLAARPVQRAATN